MYSRTYNQRARRMTYPKLLDASVDHDFVLQLHYDNGEVRHYDFAKNLSHPFYASLANKSLFSKFHVQDGEIIWASGQDFCPFTLYDFSA